jgi:quinol monooxygenase YgiN
MTATGGASARIRGPVSIIFLHEFAAVPNRTDELRTILRQLVQTLEVASGCRSCQLVQSRDSSARFIVMAIWESLEAHERAVDAMPVDLLQRAMTLVSEMPRGGVWDECG